MTMGVNLTIRPLNPDFDLAGVKSLYNCAMQPPEAQEAIKYLNRIGPSLKVLVAVDDDDEEIGVAVVQEYNEAMSFWYAAVSNVVIRTIHEGCVFEPLVRACFKVALPWKQCEVGSLIRYPRLESRDRICARMGFIRTAMDLKYLCSFPPPWLKSK